MNLSKEQFNLLKVFYRKRKIKYTDLPKYGVTLPSDLIHSLETEKLLTCVDFKWKGNALLPTAYKITPQGVRVYEDNTCNKRDSFIAKLCSWLALIISLIALFVSIIK